MDITRIDPADDAALRDWHSVLVAVQEERGNPGGPDPYEYIAAAVRHRPAHEPNALWLVTDGGRPAGMLWARWWDAEDNRHRLDVEGEFVPGFSPSPELLAPLVSFAESIGRTLLGLSGIEGSTFDRLATEAGAKLGQTEIRNVLLTESLDRSALASWASPPAGYSVVAFDDPCPEELVESFAALRTAMNDAPRGGLALEDIVVTPERIRAGERARVTSGMSRWIVCARHDATGSLVGFTELEPSRWRPKLVEQGDTVVVRAHRGHGLGLVVKAVNLLRLLDDAPAAEAVETWNAQENAHMLKVNHQLGFRQWELGNDYDLEL